MVTVTVGGATEGGGGGADLNGTGGSGADLGAGVGIKGGLTGKSGFEAVG